MGDTTITWRPKGANECSFEQQSTGSISDCRSWRRKSGGKEPIFEIYHTFTPEDKRGQGHADEVTEKSFAYAKKHGMAVWPTCEYVANTFLERHPQHKACCVKDLKAEELEPMPLPSSDQ
ncbi:hypothetical protein HDU67_006708 [Dinochytrium kinnereticum]|nr:hypothetical protein HDU67_006708 [Dinochytrium kinnereticum]